MRNVSRRSFTVEVKSTGRRASTIIPTRVAAAPAPVPQTLFSPAAAPREPVAEKRRVLPNLIEPEVPEIEIAPPPVAEDAPPRRPRGRPRKHPLPVNALPMSPLPVARAAIVAPEPVVVAAPPPVEAAAPAPAPRKRKEMPGAELPRGERWKTRRLGRWSR